MSSNDAVLIRIFREDNFNPANWSACGRTQIIARPGSQIFAISQPVILRVAAKDKVNAYFPILWCNHIALSLEVDRTENSLLLSLSLLAVCTYVFVAPLGRCAI